MTKGKLIVISGPSGVGKGTIIKSIIKDDNNTVLSVSSTTRKPRAGETDKKDYYFLSKEEFEEKIKKNEFAEYASYAGNYYGTDIKIINEVLLSGKNLILEIDVQGAIQIKEKYQNAILIFILPPDTEELKKRLTGRNTENPETINLRLSQVERELENSKYFDYQITNDDLTVAIKAVNDIIKK